MKNAPMPYFQILKGWIFIAVVAAAFYLIAKVMEQRHWETPPPTQTQDESPMTAPVPSHDARQTSPRNIVGTQERDDTAKNVSDPSQDQTLNAPPQVMVEKQPTGNDEPVGPNRETGTSSTPTRNLAGTQGRDDAVTSVSDPSHDQALNAPPQIMVEKQPTGNDEPVRGTSPLSTPHREETQDLDDAVHSVSAPLRPMDSGQEAPGSIESEQATKDTDPELSSREMASGPEAEHFEPPETYETASGAENPAQSLELTTCTPFPQRAEPAHATEVEPNTQMLLWRDRPSQPLTAIAAGEIVNISQSPFTGTTVYQLSEDGRYCFVYGHLSQLEPGIQKGKKLNCGIVFGKTGSQPSAPSLGLKVLVIQPGSSWWQGIATEPGTILPHLLPPEPEEPETETP